jgi:predicted metal-dependent hydrolase
MVKSPPNKRKSIPLSTRLAMANESFMGRRRRSYMPSFPGSHFRKKNPYFQNVANDPGTAPRAKQVMTLKDRRVLVVYQSDRRARRIILRFDHGHGRIVVVLPKRVSVAEGRRFALLNRGWIRDRLDLLPEPIPFRPGARIPYLGVMHRIRHRPGERGGVWRENDEIIVTGHAEHLARRLEDWLKREARKEIERRAYAKAELLGKRINGITIRDGRSRWGSCSPKGRLSFSWRLIMAPRTVVDYVVAHEVAHLRELNHGPRFWRLTAELTRYVEASRTWLNDHGISLHRYGLKPV